MERSQSVVERTWNDVTTCYEHAWETLVAQLPVMLIAGVGTGLVVMAGSGLTHAGFLLWPIGLVFGAMIVTPIKWAFAALCLRAVRGRRVDAEDMLRVVDRYREVVIAGIVCSVLVIGGLMLLVVPGIYLYLRLQFVSYLVVNEELDALDAVQESLRLTRGLEFRVAGIAALGATASAVGAAIFGIGMIPAMILWELATASLFEATLQAEGLREGVGLEDRLLRHAPL